MDRMNACLFLGVGCLLAHACGSEVPGAKDAQPGCTVSDDCQAGYTCHQGKCVPRPDCTDLDGDTYCDAREGCDTCTDCNDNRSDIHPGAEELCDGFDNDCDGQVDEDCPCLQGDVMACGTDVGACRMGMKTCEDGMWGPCIGGIQPDDESCDDNLDNDCNGAINDGCPCRQGDSRACGNDVGACTPGTQSCEEDGSAWVWGDCQGGTPATEEVCGDELDNDCEGSIDNGCPCQGEQTRPCGSEVGICHAGLQHCVDGLWGSCRGARLPEVERCDGLDNDCDTLTDEGCDCLHGTFEPCGDDTGECRVGTRTCVWGYWGPCTGEQGPVAELCDGRDNDCDGEIDEDFPDLRTSCEAGTGICVRPGVMVCTADMTGTMCSATPGQGYPEACDGVDNDCDGSTDEDFSGLGEVCSTGRGACFATGVTVCGPGGGIACNAEVIDPSTELCDGIDNDCDGVTDENFPMLGLPCTAGAGACFSTGNFVCAQDGSGTVCDATPGQGTPEACDGLDNDCDGAIDEEWTEACSTACGDGFRFCVNGQPGPCSAREPDPDDSLCDHFDNDCDGQVDEDVADLGTTCQVGVGGCLSLGFRVCDENGGTRCNAVAGTAQPEGIDEGDTCYDGVDNNCDGATDGDDDACTGCKNLSSRDLAPLHLLGFGLGMVVFGRRRRGRGRRGTVHAKGGGA